MSTKELVILSKNYHKNKRQHGSPFPSNREKLRKHKFCLILGSAQYDDVPERELIVCATASLGRGGIVALAVSGEGAVLVGGGAGAEATCVRGATRACDDEDEGEGRSRRR